MIQASHPNGNSAQAVKTGATFSLVNSAPQRSSLQKIHLVEVNCGSQVGRSKDFDSVRADGRNLLRQTHKDQVTSFAPFEQAQRPMLDQSAYRLPHRVPTKAKAPGRPFDRKTQPDLSFQSAVTQEVHVDRAVHRRKRQPRHHKVLDLFPHEFSIGFFGFHDLIQSGG